MDKKYISRAIPVTGDKLEVIEAYRVRLEEALGFKVSLSDAITHAIKTANKYVEGNTHG
jgi:hypothetical protein